MNLSLLLQNLRGYPLNTKKFISSLDHLVKSLITVYQNTLLVCLQEFVPGKNAFFMDYLMHKLPGYDLILPKAYDPENWRSSVSAVLIKKGVLVDYNMLDIPPTDKEDFSYLYNYLTLKLPGEEELSLFNIHHIQLSNQGKPISYQLERIKKHQILWESFTKTVINLAKNKKKLIIAGDFNAEKGDPNFDILSAVVADTYDDFASMFNYSYSDPAGGIHRYDHILTNFGGKSVIDPSPYIDGVSDHTAVFFKIE